MGHIVTNDIESQSYTMILHIPSIFDPAVLEALTDKIAQMDFEDGNRTAGWAARTVKQNQQAADTPKRKAVLTLVEQTLRKNPLFASAALPKSFPRLLVNRYGVGMSYGSHVDDSLINGQRTDLSFTLGLTPKADYQGGELVLEDSSGERAWKLGVGELLLYPSSYLHRVEPVSEGERLAVVGWVRSHVRHPYQREILLDLDTALREEFDGRGKTAQFDRLSRTRANLQRLWIED